MPALLLSLDDAFGQHTLVARFVDAEAELRDELRVSDQRLHPLVLMRLFRRFLLCDLLPALLLLLLVVLATDKQVYVLLVGLGVLGH